MSIDTRPASRGEPLPASRLALPPAHVALGAFRWSRALSVLALACSVAHAQTVRVSVASSGLAGNQLSSGISSSADGNVVAYYSRSTNLVSNDTNAVSDCFVTTLPSRTTTRVSVGLAGAQGNGASPGSGVAAWTALSRDGRYVVFMSEATNLAVGDVNTQNDVYVHDRSSGTTSIASLRSSVAQSSSNGRAAIYPNCISDDGRYVAFESIGTDLVANDTNLASDIFVRDRVANTTTRVSVGMAGANANGASTQASISADGRYVLFASSASNIVDGDTNGASDVFLHDRSTGTTSCVSRDPGQLALPNGGSEPSMSSDARHVVYLTTASMVAEDVDTLLDAYWRDRATGLVARASQTSAGAAGAGGGPLQNIHQPTVSDDGRRVAFASDRRYVPEDSDALWDVYLHDRNGQPAIARRSVNSAQVPPDGGSVRPVLARGASSIGFASTATNLVVGQTDTNGVQDCFVSYIPVSHDRCETPRSIAGTGVFPLDSVTATTGTEGQGDEGCGAGMSNDVWFRWTAGSSGLTTIDTCLAVGDTKIVVRAGTSCPPSAVLACSDDGCGPGQLGATVAFQAVQGASYGIQVARTTHDGTGQLRIYTAASNDECGTPLVIAGGLPNTPVNTTNASTGTQGQGDYGCGVGIAKDVWFSWTAPASGQAFMVVTVDSTPQGPAEPKFNVYEGSNCATATVVSCSETFSMDSGRSACFSATAGRTYLFQIGSATPNGFVGSLAAFNGLTPSRTGCEPLDYGTATVPYGEVYGAGIGQGWLQRFGEPSTISTVMGMSTAWGSPVDPYAPNPVADPNSPPNGTAARMAIWDDPNDDGDPSDAILLREVNVTIAGSGTAALQSASFDPPVVVNGYYFVGAGLQNPTSAPCGAAPLDRFLLCTSWDAAWYFYSVSSPLNFANLSANASPPGLLRDRGIAHGQLLTRPICQTSSPYTLYCFGESGDNPTSCPCLNEPNPGSMEGCKSSLGYGARLRATGVPSVS
ncbi:MAG: hypothetical protein RL112_1321, partial [Planctomycetota bacterium]